VAKLDDTRIKNKDMYVLGTGNTQEQQYAYQTRDSSSTLYTDLNKPVDLIRNIDNRKISSMSEQQRREFSSRMTTKERMTMNGAGGGVSENSSTLITGREN
jgi:saccharopine dehydrogenase-like NADP-dependent oxidoreductase